MTATNDVRKIITKSVIVILIMLGVLWIGANVAQAKELKANQTYSYDLNRDGKKENVKYTVATHDISNNGEAKVNVGIYINGEKKLGLARKGSFELSAGVYVTNSTNNKKKDIYVEFEEVNGCFVKGYGYQYKDGKIKLLFTHTDKNIIRTSISDRQSSKKTVKFDTEYSTRYLGQGILEQTYKISNKKLVPIKQQTYKTTSDWRKKPYKARRTLEVKKSYKSKKVKFTIKSGSVFYVYKVRFNKKTSDVFSSWDDKNKITFIYVKTKNGKNGWMKIPNEYFYTSGYGWNGYMWG